MFDDDRTYTVVEADDGAYSLWPADREPPSGWTPTGDSGDKRSCLDVIASRWVDFLPGARDTPVVQEPSPEPAPAPLPVPVPGERSRWLVGRPDPDAPCRLYCFAHSGGGVGEYLRWAPDLPSAGVLGLQLPGRGGRLGEAPFVDVPGLVRAVVDAVPFEPPFVLFGHSLGALLAFEVARELRRRGRETPAALVLSSYRAPDLRRPDTHLHTLPAEQLLDELDRRYGGLPAQLREDPELIELTLPAYRADFTALETYRYEPEPPLDVPLYLTFGDRDTVDRADVAAWHGHTSADLHLHPQTGDHFYFRADRSGLIGVLDRATTTGAHA